MHRFVRRPSAPTVIACVALFLASTGTGLADVAQLARNSVGTPQLRPNAVTTPKIRNAAVTTPKIRNRAVTLSKLAPNARIPGPRGPAGPQGAAGPQGPAGTPANITDGSITTAKLANNAVTGPKLASNAVTAGKLATMVRTTVVPSVANGTQTGLVTSECTAGEKAIGGGANWTLSFNNAQAQGAHIVESRPLASSWVARGYNGSGNARGFAVSVLCMAAG